MSVFVCSFALSQPKKQGKKLKPKSVGFTFSEDYSYRWLYDNPRYIDSTGPVTDKELIRYRNKYDKPRWGKTGGVVFERVLDEGKEKFRLQTGIIVSETGEKINRQDITDPAFANLMSGHQGNTILNNFIAVEFPVVLKVDVTPPGKFFESGTRNLFGMAGVSFGTPVIAINKAYTTNSIGNFMVRPILGMGLSQRLIRRISLNIAAVARYSAVPLFRYEVVNSYYYSVGVQAQLLFRLANDSKKPASTTVCKFAGRAKAKKNNNILHGFIYGLNVSRVMGSDIQDPATGLNGLQIDGLEVTDFTMKEGRLLMEWGTHIGLHTEKMFYRNKFAVVVEYIYSRKGFRAKYEYTGLAGRLLTTANVRLNYVDVPIMFRYNYDRQWYVFAGFQPTFTPSISNRISIYYQYFNTTPGVMPVHGSGYVNDEFYFPYDIRWFLKGYVGGIGVSLDDRVDMNFRLQKTSDIAFEKNFYNVTAQASLLYLFGKR